MKAVVGIDGDGLYRSALHLLSRFRFEHIQAELVHVDEPLYVYSSGVYPLSVNYTVDVQEDRRKEAEHLLERAVDEACLYGIGALGTYELGSVTSILMRRADESHANVIAVGATKKSKYGRFFLGSVGRGLTIGAKHSVLIAKENDEHQGKLTAVLATDHSEYAEECIRMFVRMQPKGLDRLVIVHAYDRPEDPTSDEAKERLAGIKEHAESMVRHLRLEGLPAECRVVEGSVNDVIDANMKDTKADVLILGAHGHGFLERLFIGSVSLQEAVASPYSVLLLRTS